MWLKLPSPSGPHMWPLSESGGNLFVGGGFDSPPGIYSGNLPGMPEYQPCDQCGQMTERSYFKPTLLLRFGSTEHAAESLSNLFIMWAHCKNALYLVPQGVYWVLDPALKEKPMEAK